MKTYKFRTMLIIILTNLLFSSFVIAQTPQKMSYQAVIRNNNDQLMPNTTIGIQISILQGSATGTPVYVETQTPTTNANGLISIEIGSGTIVTGTFAGIDWSAGPYFIKTETDITGGINYTISGTSQLLSVPYALHAKTAETLTSGFTENDPIFNLSPAGNITTTDITNWNNKLDVEVDGSITNEIQALSISNDTIYLSIGGFVKLPAAFSGNYSDLNGAPTNVSAFTNDAGYLTSEVDGSVTNEIQALSISNDTIYLSNGGFVKLPAGFSGNYSDLNGAPTNVSAFTNDASYLTSEVDGSVTNEIQVLSISNDTIYLSNGGFVKLPVINAWLLNGNSGTNDTTNFIGTIDNVPLRFKVNNQIAGKIDQNLFNSFFGYQAGSSNTSGINNTAYGYQSLFLNTTGHENISIGNYSMYENTIGSSNTALGYASLNKNTSGAANTAIGYDALFYNTTGSENTATGRVALHYNTTGVWNTANGSVALYNNTIGNNNTSVGYASLFSNTSGNNNTAIGWAAGNKNVSGSGNVFIGYKAGFNETGSNKLYIANSEANPPLIYGDFSTGNVGIGTTSPGVSLSVRHTTFGTGLSVHLGMETNDCIMLQNTNVESTISSTNERFHLANNGANIITLYNGMVGIGTITPEAQLDITEFAHVRKAIYAGRTSTTTGATGYTTGGINPPYTSVALFNENNSPYIGFYYQPGNKKMYMHMTWNGDIGIGNQGQGDIIRICQSGNTLLGYSPSNNPSSRLSVLGGVSIGSTYAVTNAAPSNGMLVEGNVGIGTTNPTEKLEVNGNVKVSGSIYAPGTIVQMIVKTTETTSSLDVTDYTEASTDYRIDFTPKFNNSIILIEYTFPINAYMASNTIFDMQIIRNIGGTEVPIGVGPVNGNRQQVSFVGRPGNGYDWNDRNQVYMIAKDTGLTAGTTYTYGFKYRRETAGSGTCYFNYSNGDSNVYGFSGVMTIKVTEIAQ
ncbi:MAG: hypothetical protein HPY79_06800 [Bacteroidales bacterium]|nr:hypothetical protein [Bacteroidales bacterium]